MRATACCALVALSCLGCTPSSEPVVPDASSPEVGVIEFRLAPPCDDRRVEFSGMAWHGDTLILLPQYPGTWRGAEPALYAVAKQAVLMRLDGVAQGPLVLDEIPIDLSGVDDTIPDYQGLEAIGFDGDDAWLVVECAEQGYVLRGQLRDGRLVIDPDSVRAVPYPRHMRNMGFETVLAAEGGALALFEANGANLGRFGEREGVWLAGDGEPQSVGVEAIEFRITDATALDDDGRFWVSNYLYPGNQDLECPKDPLRTGPLPTHDRYPWVERLVELQLEREGESVHVRLTDTPPVWLSLASTEGRNWEGIVRLDDRGFLIVTDMFPRTILGFVPVSDEHR